LAAEGKTPLDGVVGLRAITDSVLVGQKLRAVVVEYKDIVDPVSFNASAYVIQDLGRDGKSYVSSTITDVYTNDKPMMKPNKQSEKGGYVIIETSTTDGVGIMVTSYHYIENDKEKTRAYWLKPDVNTFVKQVSDIHGSNGSIISRASNKLLPMTESTINLKVDEFRDEGASAPKGQQVIQVMTEFYKNMGISQAEINKILLLNVYYEPEFKSLVLLTPNGDINYHGATKLVYENHRDEFMPWILSKSKTK